MIEFAVCSSTSSGRYHVVEAGYPRKRKSESERLDVSVGNELPILLT
jgi:hypothetical protein